MHVDGSGYDGEWVEDLPHGQGRGWDAEGGGCEGSHHGGMAHGDDVACIDAATGDMYRGQV